MPVIKIFRTFIAFCLFFISSSLVAEVTRIEVTGREVLSDAAVDFSYEGIQGVVYFTLDPEHHANEVIADIDYAPLNSDGLVEFSADFKLMVPPPELANGGLLYNVNNRGRNAGSSGLPPEISLQHPLSRRGFTYLVSGWINELSPGEGRIRLHAPAVGTPGRPITGPVRYEITPIRASNDVNIAGGGHLAYEPTESGLAEATLSRRIYQTDPRVPVERSRFTLDVREERQSNQPIVTLNVDGGLQPGNIYELIYEARNPVLAGAGMAGIRDLVSLIRYGGEAQGELGGLSLPAIEHTVAWGSSQSGRLLRQFLNDGFNADLQGRIVFDGVVPFIAGGGFGMFNNRFAMPTRTNGQHTNHLFPNDLFPFTYGESTDPFTGRTDGILSKARANGTTPKVMHIQTSNEYWIRGGSLPHTNPEGTEDAVLPDEVRFYTIGGSQHGSGNGIPRAATTGQLPPNPTMWTPIALTLVNAMYDWVAGGGEPPPSRYPKISNGTLVPSHVDGRINRRAWNRLSFARHPEAMYRPSHADYGDRWDEHRIIDNHPDYSDHYYGPLVPAVDADNNDLAAGTILPPTTMAPLATFTAWNLRAPATGAERALAYLSGGYIPFASDTVAALQARDQRNSIAGLYRSFDDYLAKYEAATDQLIDEGYLLPDFKQVYMDIARGNVAVFE